MEVAEARTDATTQKVIGWDGKPMELKDFKLPMRR
jgi:hypothetical protein